MIIRLLRTFVLPVVAIGAALLVGMLFLAATGYPALGTFRDIFVSCFRDWYGFGQVLRETTLLTFTGLAVALGFRAGLFNIGAEGQLCIGALAVGIAGHYVRQINPHTLQAIPWAAWVALFIGIAFLAGGIWGGIPGVLKATTGAHEVITTMMMNFIAFSVVSYMLRAQPDSFAAPESRHTYPVPQYVRIPRLGAAFHVFQGSVASYTVLLALVSAVVVFLMLRYTRLGYGIRAVGYNPVAARLAGISPGRITVIAMFLSGGLSGLVGVDYVLGYKGYFEEGVFGGVGLSRHRPLHCWPTTIRSACL